MGGNAEKAQDANKWRIDRAVEEAGSHEAACDWVDPSRIDSNKPMNGLVRRFRSSHLDRMYRRDKPEKSLLTFRQFYAGDWYRSQYRRAGITGPSVISSYGERTSGGEPSYGLPRTAQQLDARALWREARNQFPRSIVGFMDRLLIHDELPRYAGRARMRAVDEIGFALDCLADWLKLAKA